MTLTSFMGSKSAKVKITKPTPDDLHFVNDLVNAGRLKPVIDRIYPLEQVAEAHRYAEAGHAKGKIVVRVEGGS